MKNYLVIVKFLVVMIGLSGLAGTVSAADYSRGYGASAERSSHIVKVGYGRCHKWRYRCADRWGKGSWEYRRCVRKHDCSTRVRHHRVRKECRVISRRCEDRYDYGTSGYRHCVRKYGCGRSEGSYGH